MTPVLETVALCKKFGPLQVVSEVNFQLAEGARHALIGPNGAGKTSFINLVTGCLSASSGKIILGGADVTGLSQEHRVKRGLGRTFQINTLLRGLPALENVFIALAEREGIGGNLLRPASTHRHLLDEAYELLQSLRLGDDALTPVKELPYGKQRLVELAIALGLKPRVLLLDEPAAGLPSTESAVIVDIIERLPPEIAVLMIDHDMGLVFRFAKRITVLVQGAVLVDGTPAEIKADARVREVYLGERHHA